MRAERPAGARPPPAAAGGEFAIRRGLLTVSALAPYGPSSLVAFLLVTIGRWRWGFG